MGENRFGRRKYYLKHKEFVLNLWNHTPRGRRIGVSKYTVESKKLPDAFDGFRIVQLSDIHGKEFGKEQHKLIHSIRSLKPDLILITGDIVQEFYEKKQRRAMICLLEKVPSLAPTYMILGNHETRSPYLAEVLSDLAHSQVHLLRNEGLWLGPEDRQIFLFGLETGITSRITANRDDESTIAERLEAERQKWEATGMSSFFWILMAHKPENFAAFQRAGVDLTFSGHAHGGFMRIPGRRLIAPGQGFFPAFTHGLYQKGENRMIVSQGLGGPRFGIEPELVLAVLRKK